MTSSTRIVQLFDLRFGQENPRLILSLLKRIQDLTPDVVVINGNFTQTADRQQFKLAQSFLRALPAPVIAVPGDRDLPHFNPVSRIFRPLDRFRKSIEKDPCPLYDDGRVTIVGLNTARSRAWRKGKLDTDQSEDLRARLESRRNSPFKILVSSRPFMVPGPLGIFGPSTQALDQIEDLGIDMILSGYGRTSVPLPARLGGGVRPRTTVQASILCVKTSSAAAEPPEGRGNGFNLINVCPERVNIQIQRWQGDGFKSYRDIRFDRHLGSWERAPEAERGRGQQQQLAQKPDHP